MKMASKVQRRDRFIEYLKHRNIEHRVVNNGWHVIVHNQFKIADVWPSTQKYRVNGKYGVGIAAALKAIGLEVNPKELEEC